MATVGFRFQKEWINERPPAIFVGTIGSALYIVSLITKVYIGLLIGWILVVPIKLMILTFYLGNKHGIKYIFNGLKHSWISRGSLGIILFAVFGGLLILDVELNLVSYPQPLLALLYILSMVFSGLTLIYDGFIQSSSKSISFWCNGSLPILLVSFALLNALLMINSISTNIVLFKASWIYLNILITLCIFSLSTFLWTSNMLDIASRESVRTCIKGQLAPIFWISVILSLIVPLVTINIAIYLYTTSLLYLGTISEIVGTYLIIYVIIKAGIFRPLVYPWTYPALRV